MIFQNIFPLTYLKRFVLPLVHPQGCLDLSRCWTHIELNSKKVQINETRQCWPQRLKSTT